MLRILEPDLNVYTNILSIECIKYHKINLNLNLNESLYQYQFKI